jgi:hypothetical protein
LADLAAELGDARAGQVGVDALGVAGQAGEDCLQAEWVVVAVGIEGLLGFGDHEDHFICVAVVHLPVEKFEGSLDLFSVVVSVEIKETAIFFIITFKA